MPYGDTCNLDAPHVDTDPWAYDVWTFYVSDDTLNEAEEKLELGGAATGTVIAFLKLAGVIETMTPPAVGAFVAGMIITGMKYLQDVNEGCGVKITYYVANEKPIYSNVEPQ